MVFKWRKLFVRKIITRKQDVFRYQDVYNNQSFLHRRARQNENALSTSTSETMKNRAVSEKVRNIALRTGNNFAAARMRECLQTSANISFLHRVVRTEFYGSARKRLLHRNFLFAPSKYLTLYSGFDSSLVSFSISSQPASCAPRSLYMSSSLCLKRVNPRVSLFRYRSIEYYSSSSSPGDISIKCHRVRVPSPR